MSKSDVPGWYAKAAAEPFRQTMFTQELKQRIRDRAEQEQQSKFKRIASTGRMVIGASIVVVLFVFLWGSMDARLWFAMKGENDPVR